MSQGSFQKDDQRRLAVSPADAAIMVGIGKTRLYEELAAGRLQSFTLGRRRVIRVAALEEWLAARQAEGEADER